MTALAMGFSRRDEKIILNINADLHPAYFEIVESEIVFRHKASILRENGENVDCSLKLSADIDSAGLLSDRFAQSAFEMKGKDYELTVSQSRLGLVIDYAPQTWLANHWYLKDQRDFTQFMKVDATASSLAQLRAVFAHANLRKPSIVCKLSVHINLRAPRKMDVADRTEQVENSLFIAVGRPESNRRRF